MERISLAKALASGDLEPFIAQCEAEGVASALQADFDAILGRVITTPLQEGQTSRSRARGGSHGK